MDASIREEYLASQVFTAPPERLHLLLIEGAARFAEQLRAALAVKDLETAAVAGTRLREILTEMITSIKRDEGEVAARMRAIYFYLIRELGEAQMAFDAGKVANIISVLDVERETWRMVCEKLATGRSATGVTAIAFDAGPMESLSLQA